MSDNNTLPKGGFFRGVLAGLTLLAPIFIGLAVAFPLPVETGPAPTMITGLNSTPSQPVLETEESSVGISVNTDAPAPTQFVANPAPLEETTPKVSIEAAPAAPMNTVSQIEAMPTNDIQIGSSESTAPVISSPAVPAIEMPAVTVSPTVEDTTQAPEVTSEITQASSGNDTSTDPRVSEPEPTPIIVAETPAVVEAPEEPSEGLELAGQTLIGTAEPAQTDPVEATVPGTAFEAFSAEFTDDGELPLMSFILLVSSVAEVDVMTNFSTLVTLAVTSDNPDANDIIESYRALGGEGVLLLPSEGASALRKGGTPSDASAFLDAALANVEGVLGVIDGPDGDVNQDTRMMSAILARLSETGHAIMTVNGLGLNRTSILAQKASVPATDIFSALGTEDGTIAVIRELDKLVLQIGDRRSVTVFAQATPNMLLALKFWLESQKAKAVTIAPVSASILRN